MQTQTPAAPAAPTEAQIREWHEATREAEDSGWTQEATERVEAAEAAIAATGADPAALADPSWVG